jgi:hypothetical protein
VSGKVYSLGASEEAAEAIGWLDEQMPAAGVVITIVEPGGRLVSRGFGNVTLGDLALVGAMYLQRAVEGCDG